MNRTEQGGSNSITGAIGKAGADFKRAFTPDSYRRFLEAAGYTDARYTLASGGPYCDCGYKKKGFVPQNQIRKCRPQRPVPHTGMGRFSPTAAAKRFTSI